MKSGLSSLKNTFKLCSGRKVSVFFHFSNYCTNDDTVFLRSTRFQKDRDQDIQAGWSGGDEVAAPGRWPVMTARSSLHIQVQSSLQITDKGPLAPSKLKLFFSCGFTYKWTLVRSSTARGVRRNEREHNVSQWKDERSAEDEGKEPFETLTYNPVVKFLDLKHF